jgi:hypothetical protein
MFSESWVGMEFHSYPAFLLMKSAAPNTPDRNQNTPKVIFITPRVFGIIPKRNTISNSPVIDEACHYFLLWKFGR